MIHRAVVQCKGGEITREQVEALLASLSGPRPAGAADTRTLEQIEREAIENCLRDTGGRRRAAARRLGIAESTLYEKIKRYGLLESHPAR